MKKETQLSGNRKFHDSLVHISRLIVRRRHVDFKHGDCGPTVHLGPSPFELEAGRLRLAMDSGRGTLPGTHGLGGDATNLGEVGRSSTGRARHANRILGPGEKTIANTVQVSALKGMRLIVSFGGTCFYHFYFFTNLVYTSPSSDHGIIDLHVVAIDVGASVVHRGVPSHLEGVAKDSALGSRS